MVDDRERHKTLEELSADELERLLEVKRRAELFERVRRPGGQQEPPAPSAYRSYRLRPAKADHGPAEPEPRFRSLTLNGLQGQAKRAKPAKAPRRWRDTLLLSVEVLALLALIGLLIAGAWQMQWLNRESIQAQQPASVATAEAVATAEPVAILPGGNTPPTPVPMPERYARWVRQSTPVVLPTPGAQHPTRIVIAKIGVDAPVVQGDGWEELKYAVGHHIGSALPGTRGNLVLAAHDDVFGQIFRHLEDLEPGDRIAIHTQDRVFTYIVRDKRIVEPTEVSVMAPTHEPMATLITCYPYGIDSHRLIVFAELES